MEKAKTVLEGWYKREEKRKQNEIENNSAAIEEIINMPEGRYEWDGKGWVKTN